jgi:hypothetical protein
MMVKEIMIVAEGDLIVEQKTLNEAGLGEHLRLVVQEGEIRILSGAMPDPEKALDELAGCLGEEPATEYDFQLKIGGLYEAR